MRFYLTNFEVYIFIHENLIFHQPVPLMLHIANAMLPICRNQNGLQYRKPARRLFYLMTLNTTTPKIQFIIC